MALVHGHTNAEWPPLGYKKDTRVPLDRIFAATVESQAFLSSQGHESTFLRKSIFSRRVLGEIPSPTEPTKVKNVAFLGTLTKNKTAPLRALLELIASQEQLHLTVIGNGPDRSDLTSEASRLGVSSRCDFLGSLADPRPILKNSDLVVTAGRGALESLSAGIPTVIATSDGVHGLARVQDVESLFAFNFTGRTPQSTMGFFEELRSSVSEAAVLSREERSTLSETVHLVGDLRSVLTALDGN